MTSWTREWIQGLRSPKYLWETSIPLLGKDIQKEKHLILVWQQTEKEKQGKVAKEKTTTKLLGLWPSPLSPSSSIVDIEELFLRTLLFFNQIYVVHFIALASYSIISHPDQE